MKTVSEYYLEGISEARTLLKEFGECALTSLLDNARTNCRRFGSDSPVGQMFRGERDFYANQIKTMGASAL